MRNKSGLHGAALAALAAAALVLGAGQASAGIYRFPAEGLERFPDTRARRVADDGSLGIVAKARLMILARYRFPVGDDNHDLRMPAKRPRTR